MGLTSSRVVVLAAGLALSCVALAAVAGPPNGPSRPGTVRGGNPVNCGAQRQALLQAGQAFRLAHLHEGNDQKAIAQAKQTNNHGALAAAQQALARDEAAAATAQKQINQAQFNLSLGHCGG
jgi:hypothetical protein